MVLGLSYQRISSYCLTLKTSSLLVHKKLFPAKLCNYGPIFFWLSHLKESQFEFSPVIANLHFPYTYFIGLFFSVLHFNTLLAVWLFLHQCCLSYYKESFVEQQNNQKLPDSYTQRLVAHTLSQWYPWTHALALNCHPHCVYLGSNVRWLGLL